LIIMFDLTLTIAELLFFDLLKENFSKSATFFMEMKM
jgi:hypothetical protein